MMSASSIARWALVVVLGLGFTVPLPPLEPFELAPAQPTAAAITHSEKDR